MWRGAAKANPNSSGGRLKSRPSGTLGPSAIQHVTGVSPVMSVQEYIRLRAETQYWPLGVSPNRCWPTIDDTASQFSVMCRTMALESRHMRWMG